MATTKSIKASESVKHRYERTTPKSENVERHALARADSASVSVFVSQKGVQGETKSKLNGHGHEWAEALYSRHPKKKDRTLVEQSLFMAMSDVDDPSALWAEMDRVHRLWCADFAWTENNGRFAPTLANWIADRGWTVEPHADKSKLERIMDEI